MSTITIETISPVHIGSGNFLSNNSDFVVYTDKDDKSKLCVIDPRKILHFIGTENIDYWVSIIERGGDTSEFLKQKGKGAIPPQYAQRRIAYFSDVINRNDTLKECIHNGFGLPYIPGSSIKGGIRTAILATLANEMPQAEELVLGSGKISASPVEKKLFGEDPYSDIFRFLHIGDAYFEKGCEIATRMINLNIRGHDNLIDKGKSQLVEAIDIGYSATTQLKIDHNHYRLAANNWVHEKPLGKLNHCLSDIESLFSTINNHTLNLVSQEIEYWKNVENEGFLGTEDYIKQMNDVLGLIKNCKKGKECILRIGHASGWRFITGAWSEQFNCFEDKIVEKSRPNNNRNYAEYDFPKSRRIDEESTIFGFIKLSIK